MAQTIRKRLSGARAETIKVGVTAGPDAQILEAVKPIAAKNAGSVAS